VNPTFNKPSTQGEILMKRILAAGSVAAFAMVGLAAAPANADGHLPGAACFGQVHKSLGGGGVGDLVKAEGGQGKNTIARSLCP
jgi:hypothetical protein